MIKDLLVAVLCGVVIGGGYFAGLWWTVRRIRTVTPAGSAGLFKFSGAGGIDRERPLSYSGSMLGATAAQSARFPAGA
jgi:hypothetical protein